MKQILFLILAGFIISFSSFSQTKKYPFPVPNKQQLAWQEAELGVVFHYDLHVFDGMKYGQGRNRIDPFYDKNGS